MEENHKEFLLGISLAIIGCKVYEVISNEPRYINNYRIHHYGPGLYLLMFAKIHRDPLLLGLGVGLVLNDGKDLINDLNRLLKN